MYSSLSPRSGHIIRDQQNKDNSKVHNGDVINITPENLLSLVPYAAEAGINSRNKEHEPSCLPYTRLDVLREIKTWAADGSDERCVFWLSGMAGTGKSTIARTVACEQLAQNQLGATFFFSKGGGDVGNAHKFFTTIAFQLASMANLASIYQNQGRWKEAEDLEVQVMETSPKVWGQEHPSTLASIANLASTYQNQGRWKEAEDLEVQVMEMRLRVLGHERADTLMLTATGVVQELQGADE